MKLARSALGIAALLTIGSSAHAFVTWEFDSINSAVLLQVDTMADNFASPLFSDTDTDTVAGYSAVGPNTVEAATINPIISNDSGFMPTFSTSASAAAVSRLENLNTDTVTMTFIAVTGNDTIDGDGFISRGTADGSSAVQLNFDNLTGATGLRVDWFWSYDSESNPNHEAGIEDPELSTGTLSFLSSSGDGPGLVYSIINPGPVSFSDSDSGFWTQMANPGDFVTISIDMLADSTIASPGVPPVDEDLASAAFRGTLVLTVTVPEPATLAILPLIGFGLARRRR